MKNLACIAVILATMAGQMSPAVADENFWREKAYPDVSYRGPDKALGALLFNSGRGIVLNGREVAGDGYNFAPPVFVRFLHDAGWDAFKLNRKWVADNETSALAALHEEIAALRAAGYKRIVLAGQSYGALLAFIIAGREPEIHAVLAAAPGGYGDDSADGIERNAQRLVDAAGDLKPTRMALFLFDGDFRDVAWVKRGERVKRVLDAHAIPNLVLDRLPDFKGHGGAYSGRFTRRYGECLVRFVAPEPIATPFACDLDHGLAVGSDIPVPAHIPLPSAQPGLPDSLAKYVGRWYGEYDDGAARILVTTGVLPDGRLRFDYAGAGGPYSEAKPFVTHVTLDRDGDGLVYRDKATERRFEYRPDGTLHFVWRPLEGKPVGSGIDMRRLPN
jgi:pimeloyl-ACP methyl ester carboxylesterase